MKWFGDLNIKHDTVKALEKNIHKTFFDKDHSNVFLGQFSKAKEITAKINKWNLIQFISFCTAKETISKMKRQTMKWEKIFANDAIDKGLVSKIYNSI